MPPLIPGNVLHVCGGSSMVFGGLCSNAFPSELWLFTAVILCLKLHRSSDMLVCNKKSPPFALPFLQVSHPLIPMNPRLNTPFTMSELNIVLRDAPTRSAPGPDGTPYSALRHLGDNSKKRLLEIFNKSWISGCLPVGWKVAQVIPLLKPGKSPNSYASFRPIALSSCVGKVLDKLVQTRLT